MMKKTLRIAAAVLAIVMLLTAAVSCRSKQEKQEQRVVGTCGGFEVLYEELRYVALSYRDIMENHYGEGIWDDPTTAAQYLPELTEYVMNNLTANYAVLSHCETFRISIEDEAIKEGFANLKPGTEYDALYEAALCRERADWIVGMNATRLFSTLYGQTLNVGRVMTPTLAMLVTREAEISGFKPEPFYNISMIVGGVKAIGERIKDKEEAQDVLKKVKDSGTAMIRKNRTTEN